MVLKMIHCYSCNVEFLCCQFFQKKKLCWGKTNVPSIFECFIVDYYFFFRNYVEKFETLDLSIHFLSSP